MLSTGAQKDTQRVEKHEAFCAVAMVWAEINRGETLRPHCTPLFSVQRQQQQQQQGLAETRAKCPSPYSLSGQLSL